MLHLENILFFIPVAILVAMVPGPDFAMITKVSLANGSKNGVAASFGVAAGICMHTAAAVLGISAIIASSAALFSILKALGAAYLFWIGIQSLLSMRGKQNTDPAFSQAAIKTEPLSKSLRQGFLSNILNPKAVIFFLTLFPQFLVPDEPLGAQFLVIGAVLVVVHILWFSLVAYLLAAIRNLFRSEKFQKRFKAVTGLTFLGFGINLLLARAAP